MTTKHTKGPWSYEHGGAWAFHDNGIAKVGPFSILGSESAEYENSIADARLIAAAPDLLEAVEGIVSLLEAIGDVETGSDQVRTAREAIAKAKGEP